MNNFTRTLLAIILFLTLSFCLKDFWITPFMPTFHDQAQVERVFEMFRAFSFGQIPPRYVMELGYGYGYPLFNYYAPLPYYIGAVFMLFGANAILATKMMISLGFCIAFFALYYICKQYFSKKTSFLAALLYTLAPYHAVQLYVRGSIGELWSYALFPLFLHSLIQVILRKKIRWIFIASITMLFLSHTVSLLMALFVTLIVFIIGLIINRNAVVPFILKTALLLLIPTLLTAYFWLPAISELKYTQVSVENGNNVNFQDHFVFLQQLWSSPWGYGGSAPGYSEDGMSFMLGKILIILGIIGVFVPLLNMIVRKSNIKLHLPNLSYTTYFTAICVSVSSIFLSTAVSSVVWQSIPFMNLIQFPWRFNMLSILGLSLLSAFTFESVFSVFKLKQLLFISLATILPILLILNIHTFQPKYFQAQSFYNLSSDHRIRRANIVWEASKLSDEFLYKELPVPQNSNEVSYNGISCTMPCAISGDQITPNSYSLKVKTSDSGYVTVEKAYFPGFKAFIDRQEVPITINHGLISVQLPEAGDYTVTFRLYDTLIRAISNNLSIITLLVMILYAFRDQIKINLLISTLLRRKNKDNKGDGNS